VRSVVVDREGFIRFLKGGGRSQEAIKRCINYVTLLEDYLKKCKEKGSMDQMKSADLIEFVN
jgi:hypothetical protein